MNILIIGSGGREHTLSWKVKQSKSCNNLFITPGNAGTAKIGNNVNLDPNNFEEIKVFTIENNIGLVIVGPEEPLVNGIVDYFNTDPELKEIKIFGPSKVGAQLEGSKDFSKNFMFRNDIPCGKSKTFNTENIDEGYKFLESISAPYVLKADGLAAGKGVLILENLDEAKKELHEMLVNKKFGDASQSVLVEEFLDGIEVSVFFITDGKDYVLLPEAKDYKRIGEDDKGPNTMGDPETQVVIPRLKNDLVEIILTCLDGNLSGASTQFLDKYCTTVILASDGYPNQYEKGKKITNISDEDESIIFHAGTKLIDDNIISNGGRVLACTGFGSNLSEALNNSYKKANEIEWEDKYFRKDIGKDLM